MMQSAHQIATGLSKLGTFLRSTQWKQGEATGLTPTQGQILVHLVQRGPARVTVLAGELAVTQPTASDAAAALLRKGHVEKRADPDDARASRLHPTMSGRALAESMALWPDALMAAADGLDAEERAAFLKGLTRMIRSLQDAGAMPVQRMCATCAHFRRDAHPGTPTQHHCAFVDAPFGNAALRLDCGDHVAAAPS